MAKFTQNLTASQYVASDLSSTFKTALDNLGWGTGRVDIAGGYRFTATEDANSSTTPYLLNTFLDSPQGRFIRPSEGTTKINYHNMAMYLPGVRDFRVNYTVLSSNETLTPQGTVIANTGSSFIDLKLYFVSFNKLVSNITSSYVVGKSMGTSIDVAPSSVTVGTSYSTPWVSSSSSDYILSHTGLIGHIRASVNRNVFIRIDSIEYKVNQNKFAFQSPNLDSPLFELNFLDISGNSNVLMTVLPYKNAKIPVARMGYTRSYIKGTSPTLFNGAILKNWGKVLFGTSVRLADNATFGQLSKPFPYENVMIGLSRALDSQISVGSNTDFNGFYITLKNGTNQNSLVMDTVSKSSGYPLSVPQKPPFRVTRLGGTVDHQITKSYTYSTYFKTFRGLGEIFYIRNACTLTGFAFLPEQYTHYTAGSYAFNSNVKIYSLTKEGDDYKLGTYLGELTAIDTDFARNAGVKFNAYLPTPISVPAGTYICVVQSGAEGSSPIVTNGEQEIVFQATVDHYTNALSRTAEGTYIGSIPMNFVKLEPTPNPISGSIRYIRDTLAGNSANSGNHWVEIQAYDQGSVNVALNKPVTGAGVSRPNSTIVDGQFNDTSLWSEGVGGPDGSASIVVDLGQGYNLSSLKIWHYYGDGRQYTTKTEISSDGVTWYTVFDSNVAGLYNETSSGRLQLLNNVYTTINQGDIIYTQNPTTLPSTQYEFAPYIELILAGTETPTRNTQMFGETWVSVGDRRRISGLFVINNSSVTREGSANVPQIGGVVQFGIDPSMAQLWKGQWLLNGVPGINGGRSGEPGWGYNTTTLRVNFGPNVVNLEGRPLVPAWINRVTGVPLKLNNSYLWYGDKTLGTSITTPSDGAEYYTTHRTPSGGLSVMFRLKS